MYFAQTSMHHLMFYAQCTIYIGTLDNLSNVTNAFETKDRKSQNSNWHFQNSWCLLGATIIIIIIIELDFRSNLAKLNAHISLPLAMVYHLELNSLAVDKSIQNRTECVSNIWEWNTNDTIYGWNISYDKKLGHRYSHYHYHRSEWNYKRECESFIDRRSFWGLNVYH